MMFSFAGMFSWGFELIFWGVLVQDGIPEG